MLRSKVLITGGTGFTGTTLSTFLSSRGYDVQLLKSNLLDNGSLSREIQHVAPDYVIHLGAISFAASDNISSLYQVNVQGSINLLEALCALKVAPKKVILASSATVYGNQKESVLHEDLPPKPVSHYGCSKLSMENMAQNYFHKLNILITRPFNYIGPGQQAIFVIPKIVEAYKKSETAIELGNTHVFREFNDIRDICSIYYLLLKSNSDTGEVVNLSSERLVRLKDVIDYLDDLLNTKMHVNVNPKFVRKNEIESLSGSSKKLNSLINYQWRFDITDILDYLISQ